VGKSEQKFEAWEKLSKTKEPGHRIKYPQTKNSYKPIAHDLFYAAVR
jgi:hypothetical protein